MLVGTLTYVIAVVNALTSTMTRMIPSGNSAVNRCAQTLVYRHIQNY